MRAASTAEDDGDEGIGEADPSVEIASVTRPPRRARNRDCRARPDARPPGDRPYARLAFRCRAPRRSDAHGPPRALTDAMAAGGAEAKRAFEAMMEMKKIDIAKIEAARHG